jgi:hypothetical protein
MRATRLPERVRVVGTLIAAALALACLPLAGLPAFYEGSSWSRVGDFGHLWV